MRHNYVFLDSAAIEAITNAVGGVTIEIPANIHYTDIERGIDLHLEEGVQRLNGAQAAQFVRYRQGYPQADIGRINAQKLYAAAMLDKLMSFSTATAETQNATFQAVLNVALRLAEVLSLSTSAVQV